MNLKPTPVSGMPAVVAASPAARSDDEISAPKSEATRAILSALDGMRLEFRDRFEHLEKTTIEHAGTLKHLSDQVARNTQDISKQTETVASVARASAVAAEISAQALAKVNTAQDDAKKMVEAAMVIQKGAIASAVREAVQPVLDDVTKTTEAMGAVVNELGLEDTVELGRKVRPGEERPERTLAKLDRQAEKLERRFKSSTILQLLVIVLAALIQQLLSSHH